MKKNIELRWRILWMHAATWHITGWIWPSSCLC